MSLLIIVLAALLAQDSHAAYKLAGPYEVAILEVNECQNNTGNQFGFTTKLTKMSKSEKVWTTNVTLVCDMDTSSKFMFSVEKWGFGGWQKNAFQREAEDVCNKALNDLPELFNVGLKRSGIAAECPVKKGFYTLTEFPTKWEKQEKFPSLPYGKYRAEARLFCSGEVIGCLSITVDVTEIPDE